MVSLESIGLELSQEVPDEELLNVSVENDEYWADEFDDDANRNVDVLLVGQKLHIDRIEGDLGRDRFFYARKHLESNEENWGKIAEIIANNNVQCAIVKLTRENYLAISRRRKLDVTVRLFQQLSTVPVLLLVHQGICMPDLLGDAMDNPEKFGKEFEGISMEDRPTLQQESAFRDRFRVPLPKQVREDVQALIDSNGLRISPYERNNEAEYLVEEFFRAVAQRQLLRVFVSNEQILADQIDDFITIIDRWLTRTLRLNVQVKKDRVAAGVFVEFYGNGEVDQETFSAAIDSLVQFSQADGDSPRQIQILSQAGVKAGELNRVLDDYGFRLRDLFMDARANLDTALIQERRSAERAVMRLDRSLPIEAIDELLKPFEPQNYLGMHSQGLFPAVYEGRSEGKPLGVQPVSAITVQAGGLVQLNQISTEGNDTKIMVNSGGDLNIGPSLQDFSHLIEAIAGAHAEDMKNSIRVAQDRNAPEGKRAQAKSTIRSFLGRTVGKFAEEETTALLGWLRESIPDLFRTVFQ